MPGSRSARSKQPLECGCGSRHCKRAADITRPPADVAFLCNGKAPQQRGRCGIGSEKLLDSFDKVGDGCETEQLWSQKKNFRENGESICNDFVLNLLTPKARHGLPSSLSGWQCLLRPPVSNGTKVRGDQDGIHLPVVATLKAPWYVVLPTGYVLVRLGYTRKGPGRQPVWEYAHRILCCLRYGCPPATVIDPASGRDVTPASKRWLALHNFDCRTCLNPMHVRWGLASENIEDQEEHRSTKQLAQLARRHS